MQNNLNTNESSDTENAENAENAGNAGNEENVENAGNNLDPIVNINKRYLLIEMMNICSKFIICTVFSSSYASISDQYRNESIFKWYISFIVFCWCILLCNLIQLRNIYQYMGYQMPRIIWHQLQDINKFPFKILKLCYIGAMVTCMYFMVKFIPLKDCSSYPEIHEYSNVCLNMKIIAVIALIIVCICSILLLLLWCLSCLCFLPIFINIRSQQRSNIRSQQRYNINFIRSYISSYTPIDLPSSDTQCSICWENASEGQEWTKLNCEHKFHLNCLTEWMKYKTNCPYCRADIHLLQNNINPIPVITPDQSNYISIHMTDNNNVHI